MHSCPGSEVLQRFLSRELPEDAEDEILAHLDHCADCLLTLEALTAAPPTPPAVSFPSASAADPGAPFWDRLRAAPIEEVAPPITLATTDVARPISPTAAPAELPWLEQAGYDTFRLLGRGGMGVVYQARQTNLDRWVAIKVLSAELAVDPEYRARFRDEAEAVARLQHPNIVQIYDVGERDGLAYLTLEYVDGGTLEQRLDGKPQEPTAAAELLQTLASAIHYAHQRGIIHRDLKPANILLGIADCRLQIADLPEREPMQSAICNLQSAIPKITDFGLAKRLDARAQHTATGRVLGTPCYMAPEQACRWDKDIGPATDVYALGVVLYEALTGRPPFLGTTPLDTLQQVVRVEPVSPARLQPQVPRDLDTICLKCLRKEPGRRYASAAALADDLRRFSKGEPILARPMGATERLLRWCRRRPGLAGLSAALVLVTVLGFAGIAWQWGEALAAQRTAEQERGRAFTERDEARWQTYRANVAAASGAFQLHNGPATERALEAAPEQHHNWEWRHLQSQLDGASQVIEVPGGPIRFALLSPSGRQLAVACTGVRTAYLYDLASEKLEAVLPECTSFVDTLAYRPDGQRIASAFLPGIIRIWDTRTGREVAASRCGRSPHVTYSPDGSRVVSVEEMTGGKSRLWDADTGQQVAVLGDSQDPNSLGHCFSPDNRRLAVASHQHVLVCDARTGQPFARLGPHEAPVMLLAYSPYGKRLASSTGEPVSNVRLWDPDAGKEIALLHRSTSMVEVLQFSPDGSRLLAACRHPDNSARLWDAATGRLLATLAGHKNAIFSGGFSPDGRRVATASMDQSVRLWDGVTGQLIAVLEGHRDRSTGAVFSPDSKRVVTAAADATLQLWDAETGTRIAVLLGHKKVVNPPLFTPDGRRVVSSSEDGTVRLWDLELLERNGILRGHTSFVYDVAFAPDGEQVASASWDGTVRLWDATTGRQTGLLKQESAIVTSVAYSRDGRQLAVAGRETGVTLWDVTDRKPLHTWRTPDGKWNFNARRGVLNPSGTLLATNCLDGSVLVWDTATQQQVGHFNQGALTTELAFSPDGLLLASTVAGSSSIRLWDTATRTPLAEIRGEAGQLVNRLAFSADGRVVAAGLGTGVIRICDVHARREVATLTAGSPVYGLAFSPNGERLAAGCRDNTIRLYDVATWQEVAELRGHTDYVHAVAFSPDGTRLVSGSGDFTVRIWDTLSAQQRAQVRGKPSGRSPTEPSGSHAPR